MERAPLRKVSRPAAAVLTLDFQNSRAKGEAEMQQRKEAADRFDVRQQDGAFAADWGSPDGKVASPRAAPRAMRSRSRCARCATRSPSFADCRRRSEKGGLSPAGVLDVQLQLQHGGKAVPKSRRAPSPTSAQCPCTERVLKGLRFDAAAPAGQRVQVLVKFSG